MNKAMSISVESVSRILMFNSEQDLREALAENEHLQYLAGLEKIHHMNFPGVYLAGFRTLDNEEQNHTAIRTK